MVKLSRKGLELKKLKVHQSRGDVNIGKSGITSKLINEVKKHLKSEECVKIKVLKSARGFISGNDVQKIAETIGAIVADRRGFTYIIIDRKYVVSY